MRTEYNKLIRDRIPEIISETGKTFVVTTLTRNEFARALAEKLVEEAQEVCSSDLAHITDELADVSEIIDALLKVHGLENNNLEKAKEKRRRERGGFEKRLKLLYVDDPTES